MSCRLVTCQCVNHNFKDDNKDVNNVYEENAVYGDVSDGDDVYDEDNNGHAGHVYDAITIEKICER